MEEHEGGLKMKLRPRRSVERGSCPSARRLARMRIRLRRMKRPRPSRKPFVLEAYTAPTRLQRSTVKVSYVASRSPGGWRAHGRYLAKEGAQREGERGTGFDRDQDSGIRIADQLGAWQEAGDQRLFKLIVSPENAHALDLRDHTRRLMDALADELGTKLEWVAIDHHNTGHPHVHVALRGVHERGHALRIPRDVIRDGKLRGWSQALATQVLGLRTEHELRREREGAVQAQRYTGLDAALEARADGARHVSFAGPLQDSAQAREQRLLLLRRLAFLENRGLAERVGSFTFKLSAELRPALQEMALRRDVQKSLARDGMILSDPNAEMRLTRIEAGTRLLGRFVGVSRPDEESQGHWIVEGVEGRVHVVPEPAWLADWRAQKLDPGDVMSLWGVVVGAAQGRGRTLTQPMRHGRLEEIESAPLGASILDLEAVRGLTRSPAPPQPSQEDPGRGFVARWQAALERRRGRLESQGVIDRSAHSASQGPNRAPALQELEREVEGRMKLRLAARLTLDEIQRLFPKREIEHARRIVGGLYRGSLVAYAYDEAGGQYVVLRTGGTLTVIPTRERDFKLGREIRARSHLVEGPGHERRRIAWQLEDTRELDRGRER
ncbi:MAG TPA: DUF3363 domain-containing protein [Myxococcota bacterium]|nr:DUF3363 domain-containing protein [Myxococcota bacterium]